MQLCRKWQNSVLQRTSVTFGSTASRVPEGCPLHLPCRTLLHSMSRWSHSTDSVERIHICVKGHLSLMTGQGGQRDVKHQQHWTSVPRVTCHWRIAPPDRQLLCRGSLISLNAVLEDRTVDILQEKWHSKQPAGSILPLESVKAVFKLPL